MRAYERPTLRAAGPFAKKTGLGMRGKAEVIIVLHKN